jgi:hypothetical protein
MRQRGVGLILPPQRAVAEAEAATNERRDRLELRIVEESSETRKTLEAPA